MLLEYLPLGNLHDQDKYRRITEREIVTVLSQSLDALRAVHAEGLTHRDIKPENILVQSRDPLHIKLADFGLSKAACDLKTFCGTHLYAAPEIYDTRRGTYYTNAVDIWSLGVVAFQYAYGLPTFNGKGGVGWCGRIISQLNDWDSDLLLDFLSTTMLIIEPKRRLSAKDCWEKALQLSNFSERRCSPPTQPSYSLDQHGEEQQAVEEDTNSARATVNHYLTDGSHIRTGGASGTHSCVLKPKYTYRFEEALCLPSECVATKAPGTKRKKGSRTASTPLMRERQPFVPIDGSRSPSLTIKRPKRVRAKEHDLTAQKSGSVEPTLNLFGQNWLQDPNCVGSLIAALGEDLDEGSTFHSESPDPASFSPLKGTGEPSAPESEPLYELETRWEHVEESPGGRPTRTIQRPHGETIIQTRAYSTKATQTHSKKLARIAANQDESQQPRDLDREKADKDGSREMDEVACESNHERLDHNRPRIGKAKGAKKTRKQFSET